MKSIKACVVLVALAALALPTFADTDVYGNEIVTYTEGGVQKTYQFWVSGAKAEIATKNESDELPSSAASCRRPTTAALRTSARKSAPCSPSASCRAWCHTASPSIRETALASPVRQSALKRGRVKDMGI